MKIFSRFLHFQLGVFASMAAVQLVFGALKDCYEDNPSLPEGTDPCAELCSGTCYQGSVACFCNDKPTPSTMGGQPVHCTNWPYVSQKECTKLCKKKGYTDQRICWTVLSGTYCTCFQKETEGSQLGLSSTTEAA